MRILDDAWQQGEPVGPTVATVGNFDGIHRGQQEILDRVRQRADAVGVLAAVVTFEPHPLTVLRPERPLQRLTTSEQKVRLLELAGIDLVAVVRFTQEFALTSADRFIEDLLLRCLAVQEVYVGSGFGFGRGREGDLSTLESWGARHGFRAVGVTEVRNGGEIISSTRIRRAIREGDVELATRLLGRPFAVTGEVVHGEGRGRLQGWPTLNVDTDHDLLPADGVYASQAWIPGRGKVYGAVTNVGRRPTFDDSDRRIVESHLFDFGREVYGERVELSFGRRLRGEQRFPSVDDLVEQIGRDAQAAKEYLQETGCSSLVPTLTV